MTRSSAGAPHCRSSTCRPTASRARGARALARVLPQSAVQWLSLRFNDVDDDGVAQLSTALRSGSSLRHLDLCGNRVGTPGAQSLAAALPQSALRSLNVRSNVVGSLGVVALARAVASSGLHELAVGSNALDADAVSAIGEMLRATASLVKLDMQGTKLGAAGAQAVRAGLKENTSLTHLYLDVDGGNADEVKPLLDALKSNTTLQVLEVGELGATSRELVKQITMTMRINRFLAGVTDDETAAKPNGQVRWCWWRVGRMHALAFSARGVHQVSRRKRRRVCRLPLPARRRRTRSRQQRRVPRSLALVARQRTCRPVQRAHRRPRRLSR